MNNLILDKITKNDFNSFYKIMEEAFPEDEHRSREKQRDIFDNSYYNIIGYKENNIVIGFIAYWRFNNFDYIEHFAVDKKYRNKKIGSRLLKEYLEKRNKPVFLEVEYPEDEIKIKRIKFYERMGFYLNDYEYVQPSYEKGRNSIPLKIMSYKRKADKKEYDIFKESVYKKVYNINYL